MKILYYLVLVLLIACNSRPNSLVKDSSSSDIVDSFEIDRKVDSMVNQVMASAYWDTVGVGSGPVQVLKARMVKKDYSTFKDVALTYKNVSDKKISAIRFRWYGINAFNEPADMGTSMQEGFGGGFSEDELRPGATETSQWSILSSNGKTVVKAWAHEVMFEDGTKWKSSRQ